MPNPIEFAKNTINNRKKAIHNKKIKEQTLNKNIIESDRFIQLIDLVAKEASLSLADKMDKQQIESGRSDLTTAMDDYATESLIIGESAAKQNLLKELKWFLQCIKDTGSDKSFGAKANSIVNKFIKAIAANNADYQKLKLDSMFGLKKKKLDFYEDPYQYLIQQGVRKGLRKIGQGIGSLVKKGKEINLASKHNKYAKDFVPIVNQALSDLSSLGATALSKAPGGSKRDIQYVFNGAMKDILTDITSLMLHGKNRGGLSWQSFRVKMFKNLVLAGAIEDSIAQKAIMICKRYVNESIRMWQNVEQASDIPRSEGRSRTLNLNSIFTKATNTSRLNSYEI